MHVLLVIKKQIYVSTIWNTSDVTTELELRLIRLITVTSYWIKKTLVEIYRLHKDIKKFDEVKDFEPSSKEIFKTLRQPGLKVLTKNSKTLSFL